MSAPYSFQPWIRILALLAAAVSVVAVTSASEDTPLAPQPVNFNCHSKKKGLDLPAYDFKINDGLYATVTALSSFEAPAARKDSKLKLSKVKGFKKDLEVRVLWQEKPAPVVVMLLGLATRGKDPLARLWQSQLYEAGFQVLTFDSVFLPSISDRSRHGVAGNLVEESKLAANVIEAFLNAPEARGRVTKVGIVGCSYGGTLALIIARQC